MTQRKIGLFAGAGLLVATILWGGGFVAVKDSLDVVPPIYMIALRFAAAGFFLSIIFFKRLKKMTRSSLATGIILAFFLFLAYAFQTVGCVYTTAGKNAFLTTVYVIFVPLITWVIAKRPPGLHVFAAALLAVIGIGLLSLNEDLTVNRGDVLTLVCGFWYAVHIVFIARFTQKHGEDPITLTILQMVFCSVFAWLFAPFYDGPFPVEAVTTTRPVLSLLYLAVFSSGIAFLLQNVGQKHLAPSTAALLLSTESVFGAVFSALLLGESMTVRMIAGCILLFAAVILSEAPKGLSLGAA
ncbi:MAG: DMT family transporter [Spirochaetaceae bacterium]|jgi:drug/metabolite transporter (DMT)-like permease|nr:DMT family transporter [Spirochaetaceae bacterium]